MGKCVIANQECPRTNDTSARRYCPAWSDGLVWTNQQTGEEKIVHCSFEAMMPALVECIKASNRPAAAVESMRNETADGLQRIATSLGMTTAVMRQLEVQEEADQRFLSAGMVADAEGTDWPS